jgi:hypothetical protein
MKGSMSKKNLITLLILYVLSTGLTYSVSAMLSKRNAATQSADQAVQDQQAADNESALGRLLTLDPKEPRDQACPLNGQLYTKTEQNAWAKRRPLAVMIENSPDARPQSGLTKSDLVFEVMAEGGVTRFMAFFYCGVQAEDTVLAPIRSAREYFFQLVAGFVRPLYVHVGGANTPGPADVLSHIADAGWNGQNDLNQFSIGYPTFVRDYSRIEGKDVATEHTMVTSTEKLWQVAAKRGWTNMSPTPVATKTSKTAAAAPVNWLTTFVPWSYQDGTPSKGSVNTISFEFWDGFDEYAVKWEYDAATNSYKRVLAGQPHIDLNNNQQIMVKNPVIMFAEEKGPIDDKKHMLYTVTGTGDALVFQNGTVVKAKWAKKDQTSQLTFTDEKGQTLQFVRGPIWVSVVSPKTKIAY